MSEKGKGKRSKSQLEHNGDTDSAEQSPKKSKFLLKSGKGRHEDAFQISPEVRERTSLLKRHWSDSDGSLSDDGTAFLTSAPFTACSVRNFLNSADAIDALVAELEELEFVEKNNDLYKFKQSSSDLKETSSPMVAAFHQFMRTEAKSWLSEVTGLELDEEESIDMFCARYDYTDYLLCHDDQLEGRRIAYILYLVPESWREEDGGALDLFDTDDQGQPRKVVESILPSRNTLAFFEVSPKSFHQVAEVLTRDKTRLSVGGWFHGRTETRAPLPRQPAAPETVPPVDIGEEEFYSWISPTYLDPGNQLQIRENFEENSEISLPNFLAEEPHRNLCDLLRGQEDGGESTLSWLSQGPANKCHYEYAEESSMPPPLKRCLHFFRSDAMFLLLSNLTGLKLHPLATVSDDEEDEEKNEKDGEIPRAGSSQDSGSGSSKSKSKSDDAKKESDPRCSSELRRWSPGCYTLIRDCDDEQRTYSLEARLFLNCHGWSEECGGFSSYVARGEDEELLSAQPEENALVLVYRDSDTLGFVKKVTAEAATAMEVGSFHDVSVAYYE